MGINLNLNAKQDYSYLFQGLSGSKGNLNFLADYASIKNGSYGKLMKAYYSKDSSKEVSSIATQKKKNNVSAISTAKDSIQTLSGIQKAADGLKSAADKLIDRGTKSIFNKVDVEKKDEAGFTTTTQEYDKDAIYKAVDDFVTSYNKLMEQTKESETTSIKNRTKSMINMTDVNKDLLAKVGVTLNKDNTLSVDEEKFKVADMTTVKSLFNGNSSYAYRVSAQASLIDFAAESESAKANTYTAGGNYNTNYTNGSIFDYGF